MTQTALAALKHITHSGTFSDDPIPLSPAKCREVGEGRVEGLTYILAGYLFFTVLACAGNATPATQPASRISVVFIEPEKFSDARRSALEPTSPAVLRELESFLIDTAARYVPVDMKLDIRVTNIDLAGDFELFRGPQADRVRITKGLTPRASRCNSALSMPATKPSWKANAA